MIIIMYIIYNTCFSLQIVLQPFPRPQADARPRKLTTAVEKFDWANKRRIQGNDLFKTGKVECRSPLRFNQFCPLPFPAPSGLEHSDESSKLGRGGHPCPAVMKVATARQGGIKLPQPRILGKVLAEKPASQQPRTTLSR